jgi:glycosyltransferase involved in cell wall biosynthesis
MNELINKKADTAPAVTIGLAVYNGEAYLRATLDSLLAQTFTDFELVISDNASTDRTSEICREFAAADGRIRYSRNDINIGSVRNHRKTLELARGKYFRWASANDLCRPTLLEKCAEALNSHPDVVVAFGLTTLIDDDGNVIGENNQHLHLVEEQPGDRFIQYLSRVGLINQFAGLTRTAALRKARPVGDYIASDIVLLAELTLLGKFFEIQEPLYIRRISQNATTQGKTISELQKFYNPMKANRVSLPLWRQQGELFRAILRSDIPYADKCRAAWFVFKCFYWRRSRLSGELRGVVAQMTRQSEAGPGKSGPTDKISSPKANSSSQPPKR